MQPVGAAEHRDALALPDPPGPVRSQRQVIEDFAAAAGSGKVRVSAMPPAVVYGLGLAWPLMRELRETEYQFRDDFIMDSSAAQETFRLAPTPWDEVVAATLGAGRRTAGASR